MNERIKELMLQAGYAAPDIAVRANKLAELIIQECIDLADNPLSKGMLPSDHIREHFQFPYE